MQALADLYESIRPVRAPDATVNPDVTVVTAYVEIDDVPAETERAFSRRTHTQYLEWMRSTLSIRQNMVIFVEASVRDFAADVRRELKHHTVIEIVDVEELRRSPYYLAAKRIIDGGYMRNAKRPNRVELKSPLYNTIMFSKFDWMRATIDRNPFGTKYFLWMDAGYGHGLHKRFRYHSVINRGWPSPKKNYRMQNTVLVLGIRSPLPPMSPAEMLTGHNHTIAGGIWGGDRRKLLVFCERFREELLSALEHNLLDDEQSIMSLVYMKYPELFTTIDGIPMLRDRCFFMKYLDASGA